MCIWNETEQANQMRRILSLSGMMVILEHGNRQRCGFVAYKEVRNEIELIDQSGSRMEIAIWGERGAIFMVLESMEVADDSFQMVTGVRQGCILSPFLFMGIDLGMMLEEPPMMESSGDSSSPLAEVDSS
ncbi:Uncharacterised protein at_DN1114 [Pycnogonum litorale]